MAASYGKWRILKETASFLSLKFILKKMWQKILFPHKATDILIPSYFPACMDWSKELATVNWKFYFTQGNLVIKTGVILICCQQERSFFPHQFKTLFSVQLCFFFKLQFSGFSHSCTTTLEIFFFLQIWNPVHIKQ